MRRARRGSILMEYVVLLMGMLVLVEGVALATYGYQGKGLFGESFGSAGRPIVLLYQRIVAMISLPVP